MSLTQEFIEAIDAIDNGISQYPTDIAPKYRSRTDLSSRVGSLNPAWNEPVDSEGVDVYFVAPPKTRSILTANHLGPIRQGFPPHRRRVFCKTELLCKRMASRQGHTCHFSGKEQRDCGPHREGHCFRTISSLESMSKLPPHWHPGSQTTLLGASVRTRSRPCIENYSRRGYLCGLPR